MNILEEHATCVIRMRKRLGYTGRVTTSGRGEGGGPLFGPVTKLCNVATPKSLKSWRRRQYVLPKHRYPPTTLHKCHDPHHHTRTKCWNIYSELFWDSEITYSVSLPGTSGLPAETLLTKGDKHKEILGSCRNLSPSHMFNYGNKQVPHAI